MQHSNLTLPAIEKLEDLARDFNFRKASGHELRDGLKMAEDLLGAPLATPENVERMDNITGYTSWITGDPVEGIFLTIPLSKAGEAAVRNGTYTPGAPDAAHLCGKDQICYGFYIGVYAGATHQARKNIMTAAAVLRVKLFAPFPCFARGATEDGVRSMLSLGFTPIEGGLPDLYVQEALIDVRAAA
jgi:hypothetical protein